MNRWSGDYFGWIGDGDLYTNNGRHVGRFKGREVFNAAGRYLGEVRDQRLITNLAKMGDWTSLGFVPARIRAQGPRVRPMNEPPRDLPEGFVDFPEPEHCD